MVDVLTAVTIAAPCDQVSEYAANPDNAPVWYENIASADWQTEKPLAVGSRILFKAHFLGRPLTYTYEVVEYTPARVLVMRTADGPFPMETTYTWEAVGERTTRMTLRNRGNPTGFSRVFAPVMSSMMRRANEKDLGKIKGILEART